MNHYEILLSSLDKPALWQRSPALFWDDEHISRKMLEAHLNPDWDAASRRRQTIDLSVRWLSSVFPRQGKILDLGCGPGLYTRPLSELGYSVTGVDLSRRSITYARQHDSKTTYLLKNYLELDFQDEFDAITMIYCDFAALTKDERQLLLKKVRQALKPDGFFLFDVFTDKYFQNKKETKSWSFFDAGGFWSEKPHLCLEASYLYENNTVSVDQCIVVTGQTVSNYLIWDTAFSIERLRDEVQPFGFRIQNVFDDVCGTPLTGNADTLCFILTCPDK